MNSLNSSGATILKLSSSRSVVNSSMDHQYLEVFPSLHALSLKLIPQKPKKNGMILLMVLFSLLQNA